MRIVICNTQTGEINRTVTCSPEMAEIQQVFSNEIAFESDIATAATHYSDGVSLIEYSNEIKELKASVISPDTWSNVIMAPIIRYDINDARISKWIKVKSERDIREESGFPYLGKFIDSDPRSVQRINTAVQAAQAALASNKSFKIDWTTQDGSQLTLNAVSMIEMPVALALYANSLHQSARSLREQIDLASMLEEIQAITWPE